MGYLVDYKFLAELNRLKKDEITHSLVVKMSLRKSQGQRWGDQGRSSDG
jgi:hypothetical protein